MASVFAARADQQHGTGAVAGPYEDVLGPGRAVEKVPLAPRPLLATNDRDALSGQDEKVLLHRFGVVAAIRLTGLHDLDVDASVRPGHAFRFEPDDRRSSWGADRRCFGEVDHKWHVDARP